MTQGQIALRVPPQAIEVEKHVIGGLLLDADVIPDALKVLDPTDFYLEKHQILFAAISTLHRLHKEVDLISVSERLRATNTFELIGGDAYLFEISSEVASAANMAQHCGIIKEKAALRSMIGSATRVLELCYNNADPVEVSQLMEAQASAARAAAFNGQGLHLISPDKWMADAKGAYDLAVYRGESTGWAGFDQLYRVSPAQTNVWTGIPGHGKSEFLDALMINLAAGSNWRVAYFSPENKPQRKHVQKLAEKLVGAPLYGIGRMSRDRYDEAIEGFILDHFRFFGVGYQGTTFEQVLLDAERIAPKINALVVDPWNMLDHARADRVSETTHILQCLRRAGHFVANTGISLHIVAHPTKLDEDFKTGQIKIPNLYNISGSAHWFNAIDNGFTVHSDIETGTTTVYAQKIRFKDNGRKGSQAFHYDIPSGRFSQNGQPVFANKGNGAKKATAATPARRPTQAALPPPKDHNGEDLPF